jgi:hypothetical protein
MRTKDGPNWWKNPFRRLMTNVLRITGRSKVLYTVQKRIKRIDQDQFYEVQVESAMPSTVFRRLLKKWNGRDHPASQIRQRDKICECSDFKMDERNVYLWEERNIGKGKQHAREIRCLPVVLNLGRGFQLRLSTIEKGFHQAQGSSHQLRSWTTGSQNISKELGLVSVKPRNGNNNNNK